MAEQNFIDTHIEQWQNIEQLPGTKILSLAEGVPQGSIHKLQMAAGTVIPVHFHPCNEYVYVLNGTLETGGGTPGTFWFTSANTKNGPHRAITSVEILMIRLGKMGVFEKLPT